MQAPARYHQVSRGRPQRPAATSWRWWRAGTHRDPSIARWQPRRRSRAGAPPRVDGGRLGRRRQQRPAAARTPHTLPITDIPACAALGAHLDHRIILMGGRSAAPRRGPSGLMSSSTRGHARRIGCSRQGSRSDAAGAAVVGDHRASGVGPCQHAAADVDGCIPVAGQKLGHLRERPPALQMTYNVAVGSISSSRAGTSPIGMCWASAA